MLVEIYYTELKHNIFTHREFTASIINNYNYVPIKTYHAVDKLRGKVATLIPYAGSVFVVRYINLYLTNLKNINSKMKFTLFRCIEKLTLRCCLQKLHTIIIIIIIIIISSTSAHNKPQLPLESSSNTAYPWRPSPSSNP